MTERLDELLPRCRQGDPLAWAELVRRYTPQALDLATGLVRDTHLAEDVVQTAFGLVAQRLEQLREAGAFAGWLRQIVRTEAWRLWRRRHEPPAELGDSLADLPRTPVQEVLLQETRQAVHRAVAQLPPAERIATELFYLQERRGLEIAQELQVPPPTVRRRLHDARRQLRGFLAGFVDAEPPPEAGSPADGPPADGPPL